MANAVDAPQPLEVDMEEIAGVWPFIAPDGCRRLEARRGSRPRAKTRVTVDRGIANPR
jgi:hypothetical protein